MARDTWRLGGPSDVLEIHLRPAPAPGPAAIGESVQELEVLIADFVAGDTITRRTLLDVHARLYGAPPPSSRRGILLLDEGDPRSRALGDDLLRAARGGVLLLERRSARRIIMHVDLPSAPALGPDENPEPDDWIAIQLLNEDGDPVPNRGYRVITPDNITYDGRLDDKGKAKIDGIKTGTCKVTCPFVDSQGDVTHVVTPGDHASSIAANYGYDDFGTVWNHANNADLKKQRDTPHVLQPGDQVFVPDPTTQPVTKPTGALHKFTIKESPLKLRVKLLSPKDSKPITNAACTLGGQKLSTDGDGVVEIPVDKLDTDSVLTVDGTDTALQIGYLNPMDDGSDAGWKARLFNMGFLIDPGVDDDDDELAFALSDFQAENGLDVSGTLDDATKSKIKTVYGC